MVPPNAGWVTTRSLHVLWHYSESGSELGSWFRGLKKAEARMKRWLLSPIVLLSIVGAGAASIEPAGANATATNICPSLGSTTAPPKGVQLSIDLKTTSVESGSNFKGYLRATNNGSKAFTVPDVGQPALMYVVRYGTKQAVGMFNGGIAGVAAGGNLASGRTFRVRAFGGTTRCDGSFSPLPSGRYQVLALFSNGTAGSLPRYLTHPVSLTVTERS